MPSSGMAKKLAPNKVAFTYTSTPTAKKVTQANSLFVSSTLTDEGELSASNMRATTTRPTVVNLTNHAYFNLSEPEGDPSVHDHTLEIFAKDTSPPTRRLSPMVLPLR